MTRDEVSARFIEAVETEDRLEVLDDYQRPSAQKFRQDTLGTWRVSEDHPDSAPRNTLPQPYPEQVSRWQEVWDDWLAILKTRQDRRICWFWATTIVRGGDVCVDRFKRELAQVSADEGWGLSGNAVFRRASHLFGVIAFELNRRADAAAEATAAA